MGSAALRDLARNSEKVMQDSQKDRGENCRKKSKIVFDDFMGVFFFCVRVCSSVKYISQFYIFTSKLPFLRLRALS